MSLNDKSSLEAIGERLKRLRNMAGLSISKLAEEAKLDRTSISFWEHAKRNIISTNSAEKILEAIKKYNVNCTLQWLMTGAGDPPQLLFLQENEDTCIKQLATTNEEIQNEI